MYSGAYDREHPDVASANEGINEGFGPAAVLVLEAYASAAFARPAWNETFLDGSIPKDVLAKLGEDGAPSKKFWSTQELRTKLASTDGEIEKMAARLQAERLLSLLAGE